MLLAAWPVSGRAHALLLHPFLLALATVPGLPVSQGLVVPIPSHQSLPGEGGDFLKQSSTTAAPGLGLYCPLTTDSR